MKAITTKYIGPTNYRGSRVKAYDEDGNSVTISYPHEFSGEEVYRKAAVALCVKMGWSTDLVAGATKGGYVFCFAPSNWSACSRAANRIADLVYASYFPGDQLARKVAATATWAEIIASELGISIPEPEVMQ